MNQTVAEAQEYDEGAVPEIVQVGNVLPVITVFDKFTRH